MIEIFDDVLDEPYFWQTQISKLKWSYEYQPVTPPMINKHWYSDGEDLIDDLFEDLIDAIEL